MFYTIFHFFEQDQILMDEIQELNRKVKELRLWKFCSRLFWLLNFVLSVTGKPNSPWQYGTL